MYSDNLDGSRLSGFDIGVIVCYFALILSVGLWTSRSNRGSVGGYFLAGRSMNWLPLGASLFASNVGSLHFVGLAGSGAAAGIGNANYEMSAIFILVMLGWLFVPVYIASGVFTMPEYIQKRFGGQRIRIYLAVLSLLTYIFTKISADLYAGALFIEQALRWNIYVAIVLLLAIAAIFTITGGLTAVIWTDFIQTIVMIIGAVSLMILSFIEVGGFEMMKYRYERSIPDSALNSNNTCGYPRKDYMNLLRDPVTGDLPWPGLVGLTLNGIWYWCADQVIVQRALAAKNYTHAKAGCLFAGFIKFLPLFILVFPGMIARILFPNEVACVDPDECLRICKSPSGCSNIAYPLLVLKLMPSGARGIMLAVMLSALMSSLTSIFNSSSTIFTLDIWRKIRKSASDVELLVVGRLSVLALVAISIAWVPIMQASQGSQLFVYIQQVSSFLQPPICAVYILAIFWPRLNEQGAFWSLMIGLLAGVIRFILEFAFTAPPCGSDQEDNRLSVVKNFHFLYFAAFLFLLTLVVAVVISLLTPPLEEKNLYRLTFWSRHSKLPREDIDGDLNKYQNNDEKSKPKRKISDATEREEFTDIPCWKKMINWICGIEKNPTEEVELSDEEKKKIEASLISIEEKPKWKLFCNVQAILLMTLTVFLFGFFA